MIHSLKPNVTRDQAIAQFSGRGVTRLFRTLTSGPLLAVAEFYLPFRLFRARISNRGTIEERLVAIDSVAGTLDLFQFDHVPSVEETITRETRNHPKAVLPVDSAREQLIEKLRRVAYQRGFFRLQGLEITADPVAELHIPYWVGFRGSKGRTRLSVIDAVRRRVEGARMRNMVENWLRSIPPTQ